MKKGQNTNTSTNFSAQLKEYREGQAWKWKKFSEKNPAAPHVSNSEAQSASIPDGKKEIENESTASAISPSKKITKDEFLSILVDRLCGLESGEHLLNEFVIVAINGYATPNIAVVPVLEQMCKDFELTKDEIWDDYFNLTQNQITDICEILLQKRPDVDIDLQDSEGRTALHIAAYHNKIEIVKYLLQKRCDITKERYCAASEGLAFSDAVFNGNMVIALLIVLEAKKRQAPKKYFTRLLVDLFYISDDHQGEALNWGMRRHLSPEDYGCCVKIVEQLLLGGADLAADVYEISKDADDEYRGLTIFDLARKSPHLPLLLDGIVLALKNSQPKYAQNPRSSVALINNSLLIKNREMGNIKLTQMPQNDTAGCIIFSVICNFDNFCIERIKNRISGKWLEYQWKQNLTFLNTHVQEHVEESGEAISNEYIKNIYVLLATFNVENLPESFKRDCISLLLLEASDEIFIETVTKYNLLIDANIIAATKRKLLEIYRKTPENRFSHLFLDKNKFVISLILWVNKIDPFFKNALLFHMLRHRKNMDGMGAKLRCYIQPKILQDFKSVLEFFQVFQEKIFEEWKNELVGLPISSPHAQITPTAFYDYLCQKINILASKAKKSNDDTENREFHGDKRKRESEEIDDVGTEATDNNNTMELT